MANRNFSRHQSLQKEVKSLHLQVVTDGSGDVVSFKGEGIASVEHAANVYTITLQDSYVRLLSVSAISDVASLWSVDNINMVNKVLELEASVAQASALILINIDVKNSTVGE